ncbi:hypothetical protein D3C78_1462580 [compost metagenome]
MAAMIWTAVNGLALASRAPSVAASCCCVVTTMRRASVPASLPLSLASLVKSSKTEVLRPSCACTAAAASALLPPLLSR